MDDTAKYLIHADIVADGVVERSDVVGAIFGQTEGLLGEELDLRTLQRASKVGRINVEIDSENGQSFGRVMIATSLDRVETAILAAALETIDRVGPCRSNIAIERIEDVRAAKRRDVVERAKKLLGEFDESIISTNELIEEVRRSVRIEEITDYEGLPAGPRVVDSDAVIIVEGRADVLTLLRYGVKNAVAVEGTNVPDAVAALTAERTTTAFLDGDRGGDLILKELDQVGDIDYVAITPAGRSVEDLARQEALTALRGKVAYADVAEAEGAREAIAATDGSPRPAPDGDSAPTEAGATDPDIGTTTAGDPIPATGFERSARPTAAATDADTPPSQLSDPSAVATTDSNAMDMDSTDDPPDADRSTGQSASTPGDSGPETDEPETLHGHVRALSSSDRVRVLDSSFGVLVERSAADAFDAIDDCGADAEPRSVVLDGELTQRVLDIAAQRGIEQIVAREEGSFVKQPTSVRVRTASQLDTTQK